jgi:hypothetical protein
MTGSSSSSTVCFIMFEGHSSNIRWAIAAPSPKSKYGLLRRSQNVGSIFMQNETFNSPLRPLSEIIWTCSSPEINKMHFLEHYGCKRPFSLSFSNEAISVW